MKKLFIEKDEGVPAAVEKVITAGDEEVVIVVPKGAALVAEDDNFDILKREADAAETRLIVESVDSAVLQMAEESGIEAYHPLFKGAKSKSLSDIVPHEDEEVEQRVAPKAGKVIGSSVKKGSTKSEKTSRKKLKVEVEETDDQDEEGEGSVEIPTGTRVSPQQAERSRVPTGAYLQEQEQKKEPFFKSTPPPPDNTGTHQDEIPTGQPKRGKKIKYALIAGALIVVVVGGVFITNTFFGKATVSISFAPITWEFSETVTAKKTASNIDVQGNILPGEYLNQEKNVTPFYPASGRSNVSQKATTQVTIYNAYSSQSQPLVATTRFETPDGRIYRIDKSVTVPGAEIRDGKIIPSSIIADATADKPGEEYNTGPVEKLTIPGFSGSPKFEGFYGELKNGAEGGFIGERATPTDEDVESAEQKTRELLAASLETSFAAGRPDDFTIIEGTSDVNVTRLSVNKNTDDSGNFSVFGEARFQAVAFRENDVRTLLLQHAHDAHPGTVFREIQVSYENARVDFESGEITMIVKATAALVPDFDPESFKGEITSLRIDAARSHILDLPQLGEAKISLWPIWLGSIPEDPEKVKITVQ
jgi:hypothetical protein